MSVVNKSRLIERRLVSRSQVFILVSDQPPHPSTRSGISSSLNLSTSFNSGYMDSTHPFKTLLQLQLASDALAVLHLPYIISTLTAEALQPSPHTPKWSSRINSLIHSKDAGARWAGLCIARQTATYSQSLMLESAQSWVTTVLPLISVRMSS